MFRETGGYTATHEMRLTGGISPSEGRLEIRLEGSTVWHSVCTTQFGNHIPSLLCADLGWPFSIPGSRTIAPTTDLLADDLGQILIIVAGCPDDWSATSLSDCFFVEFLDAPISECTHDDDVWIQCLAGKKTKTRCIHS